MSGQGSVRCDQKTGAWFFVVDAPQANGKRRQIKKRGFSTRKEAQHALDELRASMRGGRGVDPNRLTLGEFVERRWLPHVDADEKLKPTTKAAYRSAARHLVEHAGQVRLTELRGDDIDHVLAQLRHRSVSLRHSVHTVAHKALGQAIRWRLVGFNAAEDATSPGQPKPAPTAWSPEQVGAFLHVAQRDRWWPLWLLAATTGMRRGELCGLRWRDVDIDRGVLVVASNVTVTGHEVHRGTPKTGRSRELRLDAGTIAALRSWRAQQAAELLLLGELRPDHDSVFTWPDGSPVHPAVVTRTFGRLLHRAGLPPLRLHGLRHSWATNALDAGVDIKDVSTRLGHSSTRVTLDIYVAPSSARDAHAAELVAGLYGSFRGHAVVTDQAN